MIKNKIIENRIATSNRIQKAGSFVYWKKKSNVMSPNRLFIPHSIHIPRILRPDLIL